MVVVVVVAVVAAAAEGWLRGVGGGREDGAQGRTSLVPVPCCGLLLVLGSRGAHCPALGPSRRPQSFPAVATVKVGRPLSDFLSFSLLLSTQSTQLRETAPLGHRVAARLCFVVSTCQPSGQRLPPG